jgi:hypothetical protein
MSWTHHRERSDEPAEPRRPPARTIAAARAVPAARRRPGASSILRAGRGRTAQMGYAERQGLHDKARGRRAAGRGFRFRHVHPSPPTMSAGTPAWKTAAGSRPSRTHAMFSRRYLPPPAGAKSPLLRGTRGRLTEIVSTPPNLVAITQLRLAQIRGGRYFRGALKRRAGRRRDWRRVRSFRGALAARGSGTKNAEFGRHRKESLAWHSRFRSARRRSLSIRGRRCW